MTPWEKAKRLAEHYGLDIKTMTHAQAFKAVKEKAGKPYSNMDTLYAETFEKKKKKEVDEEKGKVSPVSGEVLPPVHSGVSNDNKLRRDISQAYHVEGATLHVHAAPPTLVVQHGNIDWSYQLSRGVQLAFVYSSGVVSGILLVVLGLVGRIG